MKIIEQMGSKRKSNIFLVQEAGKKMIFKEILAEDERETQFHKNNAATVTEFDHPNLLKYYGWGEIEHKQGIFQEYAAGGDLYKLKGNEKDTVSAIIKVCEGLEYQHERGYIHSDLKPGNILLTESGEIKIADFEYMLKSTQSERESYGGYTPGYAAPEVIREEKISFISDIYSLGIILGYLLTDRTERLDIQKEMIAQGISEELQKIFLTMTADNPQDRYQSIRQVEIILTEYAYKQNYLKADKSGINSGKRELIKPSEFVNRQEEQEILTKYLQEEGKIIFLRGERGVGKSAILEQIRHKLLQKGKEIILIKCDKIESGLQPLSRILKRLLELKRIANLQELIKSGVILPENLSLLLPEMWQEAALSQGSSNVLFKPEDVYFSVQELIEFMEIDNLIIIIEDLHWARMDILNWLVFQTNMETPRGYNLVVSYRKEDISRTFDQMVETRSKSGYCELMELSNLSEEYSSEMLSKMLRMYRPVKESCALMYKKSAGNPLFLRDMLHYVLEQGLIEITDNEKKLAVKSDYPLPNDLREIILGKRKRLKRTAIYILEMMAVMGQVCSLQELEETSGINCERLLAELAELCRVMYIQPLAEGKVYGFTHDSNQEEIYRSIAENNRKQYHEQILGELEKKKDDSYHHLSRLAYHAYEAGDEKALQYNIEQYKYYQGESGALPDTEICCRRIIDIYDQQGDKAKQVLWITFLIGVFLKLTRRDKFEALLKEKRELIESVNEPGVKENFWLMIADYYTRYHEIELAEKYLNMCRDYFESRERKDEDYLKYMLTMIMLCSETRRMQEAFERSDQALELAPEINMAMYRKLLCNRGTLHYSINEFDKALDYFHRFKKLSIEEDSSLDIIIANSNLINIKTRRSENQEVERLIADNIKLSKELGSAYFLASAYNQKAHLLYYQGKIQDCLEEYNKTLAIYQKTGNVFWIGRLYSDMGVAYMQFDLDKAMEYFEKAMSTADISKDYNLELLCTANLGLLCKEKKDYRKGLEYLQKGLAISLENSLLIYLDRLYIDIGELYILNQEYEKGRESVEEGLKIARKNQNRTSIPKGLRMLSEYYRIKGDLPKAKSLLDELLASHLDNPVIEIETRYLKWKLLKLEKDNEMEKQDCQQKLLELLSHIPKAQWKPDYDEMRQKLKAGE